MISDKAKTAIEKAIHARPPVTNSWWGFVSEDGKVKKGTNRACIAGIHDESQAHGLEGPAYLYMAYNQCGFARPSKNHVYGRPSNNDEHYQNAYSRQYVDFLIGKDSPWQIRKHLAISDPEWCDEFGFVLHGWEKMDYRQVCNFLIASRYAWEYKSGYSTWLDLCSDVEPRLAMCVVSGYRLTDGNWTAKYPDSHEPLSGALQFVSRFTRSAPDLDAKRTLLNSNRGNGTYDSIFLTNQKASGGFAYDEKLTLPKILSKLEKACA